MKEKIDSVELREEIKQLEFAINMEIYKLGVLIDALGELNLEVL